MLSRLRARFGVDFSFKDIFDAPTVAALAARLEFIGKSVPRSLSLCEPPANIARVEGDGPQQVSIVQERMLRIERELPGLPQFNLPFAYRLQGPLNVPALERSLGGSRAPARRRCVRGFTWRDERPVALIAPTVDINSSLIVEDLAARASTGNRSGQGAPAQKGGAGSRARSLDTLRHEACAFVPGAPLAARRRRLRLASDPARYHHRRLVDGSLHGGALGTLCRFCGRQAGAVARTSASVFRLRSLAASVVAPAVQQTGSSPTGKSACREASPVFPATE